MTPEHWKIFWHKGDPDQHMAKVILKEFISQNKKALIYSNAIMPSPIIISLFMILRRNYL